MPRKARIALIDPEMYKRLVSVLLLLCLIAVAARAAVSVTAATGGTNICSNKAVTGSAPAFTTLGAIQITEGAVADFSIGTSVIVLNAPTGWQFNTTLPTITYITGSNITGVSGSITGTSLTINVTVVNNNGADQVTITGLQVQPTTTSASAGAIRASVATGVAGITTGASGTNFGSLSITSPVTASVSLAASPSGSFCPGTNVTFTPTATNGGTPTFTWVLNGTDVYIGASYSNNSLASGNTVSCRMLSSVGCLVANPVYSNTITASVLTAPAAITGTNSVCPTTTTTLSTTSTGGAWSSSNTAVGTVSTSGVVTGVAAGTANISYTAGGCAAIRTIYVNNPPFAPVLTPTVSTICNNTSVALTATGTPASSTILNQNFNSGLGTWTVDTIGSINILPGSEWKACADSYLNEQGWYRSPDSSTFVMANADTSGSSSTLSTRLISPVFSLAAYSAATLSFQHAYDYWPTGDVNVNVDISTNGGTTWTALNNFVGATIGSKMSFVTQTFSLNSFLGSSNVKLRFYYKSTFGYYWAIDNVVITGVPAVVTPTWSPVTNLFTNSTLTTPYTAGTQTNTVYVYPTTVSTPTTFVYTATATFGACSASATSTVTVNPEPGATSGGLNVCVGTSTTLTNASAGGSWVSANPSIVTVGSATGVVTGVAVGTASISYVAGSSCATVVVVTVNTTPAAITGNLNACLGYTTTLASATTGGTWTSSNTATAPVAYTTGVVSGSILGTATITYSLGGSCTTTAVVTVQPLPAASTGPGVVCATQTITLTNSTGGGTWASGSTSIATVGSSSGIVTGVSGGVAPISFIRTTTGCFSIKNVTVNPLGPITGSSNACLGYTLALGNSATGGTWTSSTPTVATVNTTTGELTPVTVGTTTVTYTLGTGCTTTKIITVNTLPADISGPSAVCVGGNITLSCPTAGGFWSSSNASLAGVGASSGVVTGVGAGTCVITYTAATGCFKTATVTVNPPPAAITGSALVCSGSTTLLSNATAGGTWSSSATSVAGVAGGTVTGGTAGTATIFYTLPTTCFSSRVVTVNPLPDAITGALAGCQGATGTLSSAPAGGTWSSSNTSIAAIGSSSGVVTGGAAGTAVITYTLPTGCFTTAVATINTIPASITGSTSVCTGSTIVVATSSMGGTWSSSNTALATVSGSGDVTGVAPGNPVISYMLPTGCYAIKLLTVNQTPAAITGSSGVCLGASTTLSNATAGGAWSSSNPSVATVSGGVVNGLLTGTVSISYIMSSGCYAAMTVTVQPLPASISGNLNVCLGSTSALANATPGGTWSSSSTSVATIGSTSGILSGIGLGMSTVSYVLPTGCYATAIAVVNPLPTAVTGPSNVCEGGIMALANATTGGTWSAADMGIAIVGSATGIVSGISAGTTTISYILPTGCPATKVITVNPIPGAIAGPNNICQASTATLSSPGWSGGTWTSSTVAVATIGSSSGSVYGVAGGGAVITYTLPTGCYTTMALNVTSLPSAIAGPSSVCAGYTILLTDITTGGSWVSGSPSVATVSSLGVVTGVGAGTATISYVLPLGCFASKVVTVNPVPAPITGPTTVCLAAPVTYSTTTTGGTWSSSNTTMLSIGAATGVASGFVYGTAIVSYSLSTGCFDTTVVNIVLTPSAIVGNGSVCVGRTTGYSNIVGGGVWLSSNTAVATVNSGGVVSGISAGSATITYLLSTGCFVTKNIVVNPLPVGISGPPAICQGLSGTMVSSPSGGNWSSSNSFVGAINPSSGLVNGIAAGTTNITYTLPTGCLTTTVLTVHALPGALTGSGNVCLGSTSVLSTTTGGGTWSSSNPSVGAVDGGGLVSGLTLGTTTITYTIGIGCSITRTLTVVPLPPAITGTSSTCVGVPVTLSNATTGGSWSSTTSPGVAVVNATTGLVTPLSAGTAVITYTLPTGCFSTLPMTVVTVAPITGNAALCIGAVSVLSNSVSGGTWSSSNTAVAGIGASSGMAVGYNSGTSMITYVMPGGCVATRIVTVSPAPAAITGTASVCPTFNTTLSNITPGGVWTSGNTSTATVNATTGVVTGIAPGIATISYGTSSGCAVTRIVTVQTLPAAISGSSTLCVGSSVSLSSAVAGGVWTSSVPGVAGVSASSGVVTGIATGTAVITYTPPTGCAATAGMTVNGMPAGITGGLSVCNGSSTALSNAVSGGSWSSTNASVATIDGTGVVSSVSPGTTVISYTSGIGCAATAIVTVNVMPGAVTGVASACVGFTTNLSCTPAGGTWVSSSPTVAAVGSSSGIVTGAGAGTAVISYSFSSGCNSQIVVTVSPSASVVLGPSTVCEGSQIMFSDPFMSGGTWSSSAPGVATVDATTGVVTGVAAGSVGITYTIGAGCLTTKVVTVYPLPSIITGIPRACIGMTTALGATPLGGVWSSSLPAVGSIDAGSGVLYGVTPGVVSVSYTLPTGCLRSRSVTVNPTPGAITGATDVCAGSTITLGNIIPGGEWVSSNTSVATVGSSSGIVTGLNAGTTEVSYILGAGCAATTIVSVHALPTSISGPLSICAGNTAALSSSPTGGVWSGGDIAVATIGSASGGVTSVGAGTTSVTYTIGIGCAVSATLTVQPTAPNTGIDNTCVGFSTTLNNSVPGGTWTSSNFAVATVFPGSGVVSGAAPGTVVITYTLPTGCMSMTLVTVSAVEPVIGSNSVCVGQSINLTNAQVGGTWASGNVLVAGVGSLSGVVTGLAAGAAMISYRYGGGCVATKLVTVYPLSPVTGPSSVCAGQTISLADATPGGTWSSDATGVATVDASGIVSGLSAGTATISYQLATGCVATKVVTVQPLAPITGPTDICVGIVSSFGNIVSGGVWSSSNSAVAASAISTGSVTGISAGNVTISYVLSSGCYSVKTVTVNPQPAVITGVTNVCLSGTSILSCTTSGGTWSSSNILVASIGSSSGLVNAMSVGTAVMSYTLATGCYRLATVTVNPLPSAITGSMHVCEGSYGLLTNSLSGGTWSVSTPSVAVVDAVSGAVLGMSLGTTNVTYTLPTSCSVTGVLTVDPIPPVVTGAANICVGATEVYSNTAGGGSWSGSSLLSVGVTTGAVTGVSAGVATLTYTMPTGCARVATVNVLPLPSPISGSANVCAGSSVILSSVTAGGTWSTSNAGVVSVDATGVITGVSSGVANITYTSANGCFVSKSVTVDPLPGVIAGPSTVCQGESVTLSSSPAGGVWSSSAVAFATVSAAGGVTGVGAGTVIVTYMLPTGCFRTFPVTVNPLPSVITGGAVVCTGQILSLSNSTSGGVWSSDNTSVATVGAGTGDVIGVTAGSATISYSLSTGCVRSVVVTVNPSPLPVTGPSQVCAGQTITLADATPGGAWSSGTTTVAGISSAGVLSGVAAGTSVVSYTLANGCRAMAIVTVNPVPPSITGSTNLCPSTSVTLSNTMTGGTWSSTYTSVVSVDAATGVVSGLASGMAVVTYTMPTGCKTTIVLFVDAPPAPITGVASACQGGSSLLSDVTPSGFWSSSNPSVASVGFSSGSVVAGAAGTAVISYTLPTGCFATRIFTTNAVPPAITGPSIACVSNNTVLSNTMAGGVWSSGNLSVATIGSSTGVVTGVSLGSVVMSYTMPSGCGTSAVITVYAPPAAITGGTHICQGATTVLSSSTSGGTWTSSTPSIATVTGSGAVNGVGSGAVTISYTLFTGCYSVAVVTVDPLLPTTGSNVVCAGDTVVFANAVPGGVWSSSTIGVATVDPFGAVYGVAPGVAIISYNLPSGCLATKSITVNQLPATHLVTGGGAFCIGGSGVAVWLNGSVSGFSYTLVNGVTPVVTLSGTGAPLNFGLQSLGGTYGVLAVNTSTGCSRSMLSTVVVTPVAYAPAGVSIVSSFGDTVCNGTSVTFMPIPYLGGSAPVYQWSVNGSVVGGSTSMTYTPANGDTISCRMTSSAGCAVPNVATAGLRMTALPVVVPAVVTSVTPNDSVCVGRLVTFSATPVNGGTSPVFIWKRNGVEVGTGPGYTYTPTDGDIVYCRMAANSRCRTTDTANGIAIPMTVLPYDIPTVTINATPGLVIIGGQEVTFSATVSNGGTSPSYQWKVNGGAVAGATNATYVSSTLSNGDTVSCTVVSAGLCGGIAASDKVVITVNQVGVSDPGMGNGSIRLNPNPNDGSFVLSGTLAGVGETSLTITNVIGQEVWSEQWYAKQPGLNRRINAGRELVNGMYLLTLTQNGTSHIVHFVIAK